MKARMGKGHTYAPLSDVDVAVNTDAYGNIVIAIASKLHMTWLNIEPDEARILALKILRSISNPVHQVA